MRWPGSCSTADPGRQLFAIGTIQPVISRGALFNLVIPGSSPALSTMGPGIHFSRSGTAKSWIDSRHPWRSLSDPSSAFALAILPTRSGSAAKSCGGPGMTMKWNAPF